MVQLVGLRCDPPWPSIDDGRHRRCLRGSTFRGRGSGLWEQRSTLLTFAPALPTLPGPAARTPVWMPRRPHADLPHLAVRCPSCSDSARSSELPLLGLSKDPLRRVAQRGVHSRSCARLPVRRSFGMRTPVPIRVPTSWSGATSPVSSSLPSPACCSGPPTMGFTAFPPRWRSFGTFRTLPSCSSRFPAMRSCPSKRSLRAQRRPDLSRGPTAGPRHRHPRHQEGVHRDPCPLAVAEPPKMGSCLLTRCGRLDLRALLRARVRCSGKRFRSRRPVLPWAWMLSRRHARERAHVRETSGTSKTVREERLSVPNPGFPGVAPS